jgi:hypothetical protein
VFLLALVSCASLMPVEELPAASWRTAFGLGFLSSVFDNIPLTALAIKQGGYDWGYLAYAVGLVGGGGHFQYVSRGKVSGPLAATRLVCGARLRDWVLRDVCDPRMAAGRTMIRLPVRSWALLGHQEMST